MYAVILAGGRGERFWPYSRAEKPKQFLDITGEGSMLTLTYERLSAFIEPARILLLTNSGTAELACEQLPELPERNILLEPVARNTAPSLAVAAATVQHRAGDVPMLCCPADHLIREEEAFRRAAEAAAEVASRRDVLITFGITPDCPATGYGYIEAGSGTDESGGRKFHDIEKFHEKPAREEAESYLERGNYYWNSGIFLWRPSVFLSAWSVHLPEGSEPLARIADSLDTDGFDEAFEVEFPKMPSVSVDYGILEKAHNVLVTPVDLGWNDIGSWDALYDILERDVSGNAVLGAAEVIDSGGNLIFNPGGMTAAVGVKDMIVVVSGSTLLLCKRGESQKVREIMDSMKSKGLDGLL